MLINVITQDIKNAIKNAIKKGNNIFGFLIFIRILIKLHTSQIHKHTNINNYFLDTYNTNIKRFEKNYFYHKWNLLKIQLQK